MNQTFYKNTEAEKALMASLILDPTLMKEVDPIIQPDSFFDPDLQLIFKCVRQLWNLHQNVDPIELVILIQRHGGIKGYESASGYIAELSNQVAIPNHAKYYAEQVNAASCRRRLHLVGSALASDSTDPSVSVESAIESINQSVMAISQNAIGDAHICDLDTVIDDTLRNFVETAADPGIAGVCTGFARLDNLLGGLRGGQLITLAARPGVGKSALAGNITSHIGGRLDSGVLFISLEMLRRDLVERMICSRGLVSSHQIKSGTYTNTMVSRVEEAAMELRGAPIYIDDDPGTTVEKVGAVARAVQANHGLSLVVIDYLQLLEFEGDPKMPREQQVAHQTRYLKKLSGALNVPILLLAQLNRQTEHRNDHKPTLSDLRESGAIEQDSDVVIFIYEEWRYDDDSEPDGKAELIVAKQRNGPTGDCPVQFFREYSRFSEGLG